jgi:dCMP deaminase
MLIGLVGLYCSGKDAAAGYLGTKGYGHASLSDCIRDEATKRGLEHTRDNLIKLGNELREQFGPGVLAERALEKIESDKNGVLSSIRHPAEVAVLKRRKDFILVRLDAPFPVRFKRILSRGKLEDREIKTANDLERREKSEMSKDANSQQLHKVLKLANITIKNDGDLLGLHKKMDSFVADWGPKLQLPRPTWDEYFMNIAKTVAKRATCDRGRTGSVIVKNKQILTTGYVGSPKGIPHCDEIGHELQEVVGEDGKPRMHCIRTTHAEQNALMQAAKHGIPVDGATAYMIMEPCYACAKMLVNAGIVRVVADKRYHGAAKTRDLLKKADVALEVLHEETIVYAGQSKSK